MSIVFSTYQLVSLNVSECGGAIERLNIW